jgi:hypothetical protein
MQQGAFCAPPTHRAATFCLERASLGLGELVLGSQSFEVIGARKSPEGLAVWVVRQ